MNPKLVLFYRINIGRYFMHFAKKLIFFFLKKMSYEHLQETVNDYDRLFETGEGYDVIIYAGQNENVKEICAHSIILCTRSQYFRSAFSKEQAEKKDGKFIFKKPDISPLLFKIAIRYIYCGKIDLTKLKCSDILKLLLEFDELWNFCLEKICQEPEMLFNSDKFISLKAPIVELFLKRDDLCLDEIIIWDSLIKWSLAQNPTISQDVTKWNKEEFIIMERTLDRFIPLIRFYRITPENFIDKVYPFKELLPKDLVKNIFTFHMIPDRELNVNTLPPRFPKYS